ncbi:MAG: FAD-dependent oxidoreductase [Roseicyclus sp.]|nr:FAD-dependent oxidoreductase [Roseicyclus sp.]
MTAKRPYGMWQSIHRRQFLLSLASAALSIPGIVSAQTARRVVIVGAGAAGLTAAFHLRRAGVEVTVLEAAPGWGGRVARLTGFADFPIDTGAEWIHDDPTILGQILGQENTDLGIETIDYRPQTYQVYSNGNLRPRNLLRIGYSEVKFETTTWYGFFERFVVPDLGDSIVLNAPVTDIEQTSNGVSVRVQDGRRFDADHVLVTVPVSILKSASIRFTPTLPDRIVEGLEGIQFGEGFKVFLKFRERFYPDILIAGPIQNFISDAWDEKTYYDAAFGKPSEDNILGLFTASQDQLSRARLGDDELISDVLAELDEIYDGTASRVFETAHVKNWSRVPYIRGSYSMAIETDQPVDEILAPINGRVHFAGEVLGGNAQATVHGAALSAIQAVDRILNS